MHIYLSLYIYIYIYVNILHMYTYIHIIIIIATMQAALLVPAAARPLHRGVWDAREKYCGVVFQR